MMKITKAKIKEYAKKYDYAYNDDNRKVEEKVKGWLKNNRYLDKERFIKTGLWKSQRPRKHYENNDDLTVREITRFSFATESEKERIERLLVLNGVGYPVASVILHFAFPNRYPIMDFRVIESLGLEKPKSYTFAFWDEYCCKIRKISKSTGANIRTIDKALWAYSKEKQKAEKCRQVPCSPA